MYAASKHGIRGRHPSPCPRHTGKPLSHCGKSCSLHCRTTVLCALKANAQERGPAWHMWMRATEQHLHLPFPWKCARGCLPCTRLTFHSWRASRSACSCKVVLAASVLLGDEVSTLTFYSSPRGWDTTVLLWYFHFTTQDVDTELGIFTVPLWWKKYGRCLSVTAYMKKLSTYLLNWRQETGLI